MFYGGEIYTTQGKHANSTRNGHSQDMNPGHFCCKATALTTESPCGYPDLLMLAAYVRAEKHTERCHSPNYLYMVYHC